MSIGNLPVGAAYPITVSGNVKSGQGAMMGIFVASVSGTPTITVYDDAATGTAKKLVDTFTPVASAWYPMPMGFGSGCNVVLGGTVSATVVLA